MAFEKRERGDRSMTNKPPSSSERQRTEIQAPSVCSAFANVQMNLPLPAARENRRSHQTMIDIDCPLPPLT